MFWSERRKEWIEEVKGYERLYLKQCTLFGKLLTSCCAEEMSHRGSIVALEESL